MLTIHRPITEVRPGDRFRWLNREREIVRVRAVTMPAQGCTVLAVELLHKSPHRAGVDYLTVPAGSQLAVVVA